MKKTASAFTAAVSSLSQQQKLAGEIATLQREVDVARALAKEAKAEAKVAKKKFKAARRAAKKLKQALEALKLDFKAASHERPAPLPRRRVTRSKPAAKSARGSVPEADRPAEIATSATTSLSPSSLAGIAED